MSIKQVRADSMIGYGQGVLEDKSAIPLDYETWFPFAAKVYNISPNIDDYIITPVIIMCSDLPNRNGVAFPLSELVRFHQKLGRQSYKAWKGQPVHREHDNEHPERAYGVILDASLHKLAGYAKDKLWKVVLLLAIDKKKNPEIAQKILSGELRTYSMGALVDTFTCSYCGEEIGGCDHLNEDRPLDFYEKNGKLVFRNVQGIFPIETSIVEDPAYTVALSDVLMETSS